VLLSFASIAVVIALGLLFAFVTGVGAALVAAALANVPTTGLNDAATLGRLPANLLKGWLAITEEAALGFAIATLARSQLAGIGAGIAFYFGETFAGIFLPDVVKYLPFNVATASVATTGSSSGGGFGGGGAQLAALDPSTALILVVAWLVGALAVTAVFTERAEITG
jgi:hypothetical protein